MPEFIQILTTTPTEEDARRIAAALVESRLAACVQFRGPIQSVYHWKGQIETAMEWQCVAKTRRELFEPAQATIAQLHPYEVPEILAVPITAASKSYAAWLAEETVPKS